jgi:hypothetical protein
MDEGIPREVFLAAIRDRVERAEEHLDAIKQGLIAYYESEPGSVRGEFDPDATEGGMADQGRANASAIEHPDRGVPARSPLRAQPPGSAVGAGTPR